MRRRRARLGARVDGPRSGRDRVRWGPQPVLGPPGFGTDFGQIDGLVGQSLHAFEQRPTEGFEQLGGRETPLDPGASEPIPFPSADLAMHEAERVAKHIQLFPSSRSDSSMLHPHKKYTNRGAWMRPSWKSIRRNRRPGGGPCPA